MTDFIVRNEGSIVMLVPLTPRAEQWVGDNIDREQGYQPYWPTLVVEPRFINDILNGIRADSLTYKLGAAGEDV